MQQPLTKNPALRQQGLSLVELMIALTIGLMLTAVLTSLLVNMSSASRELFKSAQQIENGRFAIDLLSNNIKLAGYYGDFSKLPSAADFTSLPDPCDISPISTGSGRLKTGEVIATTNDSPLAFFIQGYHAASQSAVAAVPALCQTWIDSSSIKAGSDILVVRRLDTTPLVYNIPEEMVDFTDREDVTSATAVSGQLYAQTTSDALDIQSGSGGAVDLNKKADGTASTLLRKDFSQDISGGVRPKVAAYIRKLHLDIYFVSPCSRGSGSNGECVDGDDAIPTLKRLELTAAAGVPTMTMVPLVEGVEFMQIVYGLDNQTPRNGTVDTTVAAPSTLADWQDVVNVEIRLLVRNTEKSSATDTKTYDLGSFSYTPSGNDAKFKRHVFSQLVYLPNVAGRREQ